MERKSEVLILFLILLFSFFIRIYNLENYPRWYVDEGTHAQIGLNIMEGIWGYKTWDPNFFPPLFPLISGILLTIFGKSYFVLRITGVVLGTISILLIYLLGKKLYNKNIGLIVAILLSITTFYINRMAFMDNLVEFFFLLTLFSYIESKRNRKWLYVLGLSMGLAFLSKYTGLIAIIFVGLIGFYEKRLKEMKIPFIIFFLISLIYPLLGLTFGWDEFIFDTLYQARRELASNILFILMFQSPSYFLVPSLSTFHFWTFIGLLSGFYLFFREQIVKTNDESNKFVLIGLLSVILIAVIAKHVWWAHLVVFYPIYLLGASVLINDAIILRKFISLGILSLPVILKIFFEREMSGILFVVVSITAIYTLKLLLEKRKKLILEISNTFISLILLLSMLYLSINEIEKISQNSVDDLQETVSYINSNIRPSELVASNPNIMWLIEGKGIDYSQMAFYTTRLDTYLYPQDLYLRFKENVSLENFRYVVLDCPKWFKFNIGNSKSSELLTQKIQNEWVLVSHNGRVWTYGNPIYSNVAITEIDKANNELSKCISTSLEEFTSE